jgi:GTP cyclohydrolase II
MRFVSDKGPRKTSQRNMLTVLLTLQQALMPDVLHWLGITKIDRMFVSVRSFTIRINLADNVFS